MAEIDDLQKQLTAIKRAYRSGAVVVRHGDTQTTYRSLSDMAKIISELEGEVAELQGTTPAPRVNYFVQTSRGFGDSNDE